MIILKRILLVRMFSCTCLIFPQNWVLRCILESYNLVDETKHTCDKKRGRVSKLVRQPRVEGQRGNFLLGLLPEVS